MTLGNMRENGVRILGTPTQPTSLSVGNLLLFFAATLHGRQAAIYGEPIVLC